MKKTPWFRWPDMPVRSGMYEFSSRLGFPGVRLMEYVHRHNGLGSFGAYVDGEWFDLAASPMDRWRGLASKDGK